jgi:hypothetical protein
MPWTPGKAAVATLAVGGGGLALYLFGVSQKWWPSVKNPFGAPQMTAAQLAALQAAYEAAAARQGQEGQNFSEGNGRQQFGYTGHQIRGPNLGANRGGGRFAYLPNEPLRADQADLPATNFEGSGYTQQANLTVFRRLMTST